MCRGPLPSRKSPLAKVRPARSYICASRRWCVKSGNRLSHHREAMRTVAPTPRMRARAQRRFKLVFLVAQQAHEVAAMAPEDEDEDEGGALSVGARRAGEP